MCFDVTLCCEATPRTIDLSEKLLSDVFFSVCSLLYESLITQVKRKKKLNVTPVIHIDMSRID